MTHPIDLESEDNTAEDGTAQGNNAGTTWSCKKTAIADKDRVTKIKKEEDAN